MPWLLGTALIHSLAVTDKRGLFKSWTLLLAIMAFSFCLLATFMVRSGVLVSVHSFAADPTRGIFILAFLVLVIGGSLGLYVWRAPLLRSEAGFDLVSRESFLLFNNILLVVATAVVFGGTMAPFIADLCGHERISVGPPYFNLHVPDARCCRCWRWCRWAPSRAGSAGSWANRGGALLGSFGAGLVLGLAIILGIYGDRSLLGPIGVVLGLWIILIGAGRSGGSPAPWPVAVGRRCWA